MINIELSNIPEPKKIVVYHTGALGDLLVSTAALFEVTTMFPSSEITIIGCDLWKEVILPLNWPNIKNIIITNKNFKSLEIWKPCDQLLSWKLLKKQKSLRKVLSNYSLSIDFRTESLRFAYQAFFAKIPIRIGASKSKLAKVFFTHFTLIKNKSEIHERDRYLKILSSINENYIEQKIKFWEKNGLPALKWFPKNHFLTNNSTKNILINPTASIREKAWCSSRFRELALILKDNSYNVKIIGSPKETGWLKEVALDDFEIIQPNTIIDLIDIVKQSHLLITNTSSMQFIAAGTSTPTLTLMGSASPQRWGCLGEGSYCIKNECKNIKIKKIFIRKKEIAKQQEVNAYNNITVNLVLDKINQVFIN
ncbi:glycosyltransferase family 9 protein [Pigmentibacter sp. JX0631]|uniref:glycosyltransferase family 9 protein n=1 Tax=Pigmentibacter sp. JX0631 TaxID=2976982 RepID=UPI0024685AB1|nr:glycosyltransferase family 9 protein [Pigmentibacter sp. JX0631]WGL60456.1 glycosyltransferase family 9 protein [Pigmentibacter sp. JX0631]